MPRFVLFPSLTAAIVRSLPDGSKISSAVVTGGDLKAAEHIHDLNAAPSTTRVVGHFTRLPQQEFRFDLPEQIYFGPIDDPTMAIVFFSSASGRLLFYFPAEVAPLCKGETITLTSLRPPVLTFSDDGEADDGPPAPVATGARKASSNRERVLAELKDCAVALLNEVKDFHADLDIAGEVKGEDNEATLGRLSAAIDGLNAAVSALKDADIGEEAKTP